MKKKSLKKIKKSLKKIRKSLKKPRKSLKKSRKSKKRDYGKKQEVPLIYHPIYEGMQARTDNLIDWNVNGKKQVFSLELPYNYSENWYRKHKQKKVFSVVVPLIYPSIYNEVETPAGDLIDWFDLPDTFSAPEFVNQVSSSGGGGR